MPRAASFNRRHNIKERMIGSIRYTFRRALEENFSADEINDRLNVITSRENEYDRLTIADQEYLRGYKNALMDHFWANYVEWCLWYEGRYWNPEEREKWESGTYCKVNELNETDKHCYMYKGTQIKFA